MRNSAGLAALVVGLLTLGFLALGCGGGGGGAPGPPRPPDIAPGTTEYHLASNVVALDSATRATRLSGRWQPQDPVLTVPSITDVTPTSFRIVGATPGLAVGQIVVNNEGEGFLRWVEGVQTVGGDLIVQTSDATLEDLFQDAQINTVTAVHEFTDIRPAPGVTVTEVGTASVASAVFPAAEYSGTIAYLRLHVDHTLASNSQGSVRLYGDLTISVPVEFYLDIQGPPPSIRRAYGTIGIISTGTLGVQGSYEDYLWNYTQELPLATCYGAPIPVGPLVLVPEARVYADVRAGLAVKSEFDVHLDAAFEARAGPELLPTGAWGIRTVPEDLSSVLTTNVGYSFDGEINGTLDVRPLVLRAALKLYAAAGPYLDMGCGAGASLTFRTDVAEYNSAEVEMDCSAFIEAQPGIEVRLFGFALVDWALEPPFRLDQHIGAFPIVIPVYQEGSVPVIIQ